MANYTQFAERCCNAAIALGGGHTAILGNATTTKPIVTYFRMGIEKEVAQKALKKFMESGMDENCIIFLPQSPFYEAVDNIVVRLYREKKASDEKAAENETKACKTMFKKVAKDKKKAVEGGESFCGSMPWQQGSLVKAVSLDICSDLLGCQCSSIQNMMWRFSNHTYIFLLGCDVDRIPFANICMDLAKTQVTLQSMEKHAASTILAMAPEAISPWIGEVNGKVQVTMAYVVPGQTIYEGTEKAIVARCSVKPTGGERGAQRRQVEHTFLQIPFGKVPL